MDLDYPVAVFIERAGVEKLVLHVPLVSPAVFLAQVLVGKSALGVVVTPPVPGVARESVEVPPVILHVLPVVSLATSQPVGPFFQDRVMTVPKGQTEAETLLDVTETGQAVLAPAVRPRSGMVVGEIGPGLPVRAVVLAHRPPLALA